MTIKTAPAPRPYPALPNYTALNTPPPRSIAAALYDLTPPPKPIGVMAALLGVPITAPLTAGQRARAQLKPRARVRTLDILNPQHTIMGDLMDSLAAATAAGNPYTRIRMSEAHWRSLMPKLSMFRGVPIKAFTEAELSRKLNPPPRTKKPVRAARKQYSAEATRVMSAKARDTCPIQLVMPGSMTIATVEEIVGNGRRGRRGPFTAITMSVQCRDKLWTEAQEYDTAHGAPHPSMPAIDLFMGMPLRTVVPRDSWGSGRNQTVAKWHNIATRMRGNPGGPNTPVPYHPHSPEFNVAVYSTDDISVAWLYAQITQMRAKLREEGQPGIRVEVQVTPKQLRWLKHDPLYPHSQNWPLAYAYPGAPHKNKTYFYGVLVRRIKKGGW